MPRAHFGPAYLQAANWGGYSEEQKENGGAHSDTLTCSQQSVGKEWDQDSASVWQLTLGFDPPQSGHVLGDKW